ncbi:MAG: TetR/AcrR family transcriptional regulator [Pseudomonadota bacterium]
MTGATAKTKASRAHNRLKAVLDAGAMLFATKGYKATTMRDIASAAGMLPGSLYYHFASKQDLLLAVYQQAVDEIRTRTEAAAAAEAEPWSRLEAAVVSHVETILDESNYAKVMIGVVPLDAPDIADELTALRDGYERSFKTLIAALPLDSKTDKKLLRLTLIGAINASQLWYRPGRYSPARIGREVVRMLREPLG